MIDWAEVRSAILERRGIASLPSRHRRLRRGIMERYEQQRGEGLVHWRIAELYAAIHAHREWLCGRESAREGFVLFSEKCEAMVRHVESASLHEPLTIIHAAVEIELVHRPSLTFRQTFEYLMSEGRRQAREGFASQGFAYTFMRAFDSL